MNIQQLKQVNNWRNQYNPLRGLTIASAVSLLEAGLRGEYADLQWTYKFIEETDPDLFVILERRVSSLCEMDWNVKLIDEDSVGFDQTLADNQANELHALYNGIDNLVEAWEHLELAAFRGFSHVQPHLDDASQKIVHLEPLDQWNFVRDGLYGQWAWNPEARYAGFLGMGAANVIDPAQFIIRSVPRTIDRIALVKYIRASLSEKDWDAYVEIYGIPACFIIGPPNVPAAKEKEYREAGGAAADGSGGYVPYGSDIKFSTEARGDQPFKPRLDHLSEKLIQVGTGGLLTVLTAPGSGTLAGSAHMEAFKTIARAEAQKISQLFQKSLDKPRLERKFPGQPVLAYFEIAAKEEQNITEICTQIQTLANAGLQVDPAEASEKTGYTLTARPAAPDGFGMPNPQQALNREAVATAIAQNVDERLAKTSNADLAAAAAQDLAILRDRIQQALNNQDDQAFLDSLAQIPAEAPAMLKAICRDPKAQQVLEESITAALFNGIAAGVAERTQTALSRDARTDADWIALNYDPDQPRDELGQWTDIGGSVSERSPSPAAYQRAKDRQKNLLESGSHGGLAGYMQEKLRKSTPEEKEARAKAEALYDDAKAQIANVHPDIGTKGMTTAPYATVEPKLEITRLATDPKPFQLSVHQSFSVKDKLKAKGFRFDGGQRAWTKDLARPEHAATELADIQHGGIYATR